MSSFLEWQYWGLPCFLGWLNLKFDISKKQKMMHRSFQTLNLQPILHLKITSSHLLFISMEISSLKHQSTTTPLFSSTCDFSRLWLYPYEIGFMEILSLFSGFISPLGFLCLSHEFVVFVSCLFRYISWWPNTKSCNL